MIAKYLRELLRHAVNIFSGLSFLLALLAIVLLRLDTIVNALIITFAAFLSLLVAGFFVWKETISKYPKADDLSIECRSCTFGSRSSRGGIPLSPMSFRLKLDAINKSPESALLTDIRITKFVITCSLLESRPSASQLTLPGHNPISFPYTFAAGQRIPDFDFLISVNLVQGFEPIEFAERLAEFQKYEIELTYSFENMARTVFSRTINVQDSFKRYCDGLIQEWSGTAQLNTLAIAALKALGTIQ